MKKSKTQKGITLIALIITIIVLLILAAVTIGAVQNDGIIEYAKNARDDYAKAQDKENSALANYLAILKENNQDGSGSETGGDDTDTVVSLTGPWTQNGAELTNANGNTINVGDTVNYVSGVREMQYDEEMSDIVASTYEDRGKWKVLGADENGQILLMSTVSIGWDAVGTEVDAPSSFGNGEYGSGSRGLKVEDINKITGYNPETAKYGEGTISEYGNIVSYSISSQTFGDEIGGYWEEYSLNYTVEGKPELNGTVNLDGMGMGPEDGAIGGPFTCTFYEYEGSTYFPNTSNDPIYTMLFSGGYYILDSIYTKTTVKGAYEGFFEISDGKLSGADYLEYDLDFESRALEGTGYRAVVTLDSDVILSRSSSTDPWTLSKTSAE